MLGSSCGLQHSPAVVEYERAVASLLSCLHQLRSENLELETRIGGLQARRDQLLAVSARLLGPLGSLAAASPAQVVPQTSAEAAATAAMDAQTGLPSAVSDTRTLTSVKIFCQWQS